MNHSSNKPSTPSKSSQPNNIQTGVVKFYNRSKDFGFIASDKGEEFYFNAQGIMSPDEGDAVSFTVQNSAKGEIAKKVKVTSSNCNKTSNKKCCWVKHILGSVILIAVGIVVGHFLI